MNPRREIVGQLDLLVELRQLAHGPSVGVQQRRSKKLPPGAKSVARPSKWGNPFKCAPTPEARAEAVAAYRAWLAERPQLAAEARAELAGLDLACFCPLDGPCHRDVLLELINQP